MSAAFQKAAEDSKKLTAKPSNDELLELYGSVDPLLPPLLSATCVTAPWLARNSF